MPSKHSSIDPTGTGRLCLKCKIAEASVTTRTQHFCKDCFVAYVPTKAIKRMESYAYGVRFKSAGERVLLLPVSLGISSVTLLHILHHHLERQKSRTRRTGYSLHVLFVDTSAVEGNRPDVNRLRELEQIYPGHTYSCVALADIFQGGNSDEVLQDIADAQSVDASDASKTSQERLEHLIISLPSATARADVISTLRTKLISRFALENGCEAILYGDSTTRIAEKTLAETSKGRGFSLPWQVNDGMSPYGVIFNYPMRDLLRKELTLHAELMSPSLTPLVHVQAPTQISASAKNTTIDNLMTQYFEEVEQNYPSIVANVVRTSSKLEAGPVTDDRCSLCNMPVPDALFGIHGWGGDQDDSFAASRLDPDQARLCYGCTRSAPQATELLPRAARQSC